MVQRHEWCVAWVFERVCLVMCGCFDNYVVVLVICVLVFTVLYIVCTVYLYCFVYVYSIFVLAVLV